MVIQNLQLLIASTTKSMMTIFNVAAQDFLHITKAFAPFIHWASRGEDSPMLREPVAVMGATPGLWGTVRMQTAFLPVFVFFRYKACL
jgi:hypothetical protein